jgi:molecular chaperone DnaK
LVEARNHADSLIYSTEKSVKDLGEKVDAETRSKVEGAVADLKKAMEGENADDIRAKSEALTQVSHKLAEAIYQQSAQSEQAQEGAETQGQSSGGAQSDEDVVDADFEEVKEDKK